MVLCDGNILCPRHPEHSNRTTKGAVVRCFSAGLVCVDEHKGAVTSCENFEMCKGCDFCEPMSSSDAVCEREQLGRIAKSAGWVR